MLRIKVVGDPPFYPFFVLYTLVPEGYEFVGNRVEREARAHLPGYSPHILACRRYALVVVFCPGFCM